MSLFALLILAACTNDYTEPAVPPAKEYTDPGLDTTGASTTWPLHSLDGDFDLPDDSRPGHDSDVVTEWALDVSFTEGNVYEATLPFDLGTPRGYPPAGVTVTVGGNPIPFGDRGGRHWSGAHRKFKIRWPTDPKDVRVSYPGLARKIERMSFANSGKSHEDFVVWDMTWRGETRSGLLLPAPATARWEVTVPENDPVFRAWMSMDETPLPDDVSDGAYAVLEVVEGDTVTEIGRHWVPGDTEGFEKFEARLGGFEGKNVIVQLRSDPHSNSDHDYLFWGSPTIWGDPKDDVRRIVVIGIDTTRPDHFGFHGYDKPTSPELDMIASQSVVFDKAWTPAPRTRPSFRSATTGRYPLDAVGSTNIGEVFQDNGFATGGFVANVHLQPRFDFNVGFDRWVYDNGAKAETQVDRALQFMRANHERDTYVFLHLLDPHIFYGAPGGWRDKFVTTQSDLPERINRWQVYKMMAENKLTEDDKAYLEALYDGEIAYTSYQLGRFFHELDELGGKTLVVVHSDHGEEFWEHGGFEHNHSLYDDTTRALLMVRPGSGFEGGRRVDAPVTLADIAPTLYDYAGFDAETLPPLDGRSLRPLIEGEEPGADWARPISVGHLRYGHERWGVVHGDHKYVVHTGTGDEELFDLSEDPAEQKNLVASGVNLAPYRNALADSHGMAVCNGLRLRVDAARNGKAFTVTLPEVPKHVEILDPERAVDAPSNQAWGLPPTRTPAEIGSINWTPGTNTFVWTPGTNPRNGQIFVFYDKPVDPQKISVVLGDSPDPLLFRASAGGIRWTAAGQRIIVEPSVVLSPPLGEAERMKLLSKRDAGLAGADDMATLEALGYVHTEEDDGHGHGGPPPEEAPEPEAPEEAPPEDTGGDSGSTPAIEAPVLGPVNADLCRF